MYLVHNIASFNRFDIEMRTNSCSCKDNYYPAGNLEYKLKALDAYNIVLFHL